MSFLKQIQHFNDLKNEGDPLAIRMILDQKLKFIINSTHNDAEGQKSEVKDLMAVCQQIPLAWPMLINMMIEYGFFKVVSK